MKILYAASEAAPYAKSGGLADVAGALPKALVRDGIDCRVIMPLYGDLKFKDTLTYVTNFSVPVGWRSQYCGLFKAEHDGVTFYFIDNEYYFKRSGLYGFYDDGERFAFFSVAVLELMRDADFFPDILHANDWQTALSVVKLKRSYAAYPGYAGVTAVYTIHNIEYQGIYGKELLGDVFSLEESDAEIVDYGGAVNLTKGAVVCADYVTTVSPNYARQIQTEEYSSGLHFILRQYGYKIDGIVNGIDTAYYDPGSDPELPYHYSARGLLGKMKNKDALKS